MRRVHARQSDASDEHTPMRRQVLGYSWRPLFLKCMLPSDVPQIFKPHSSLIDTSPRNSDQFCIVFSAFSADTSVTSNSTHICIGPWGMFQLPVQEFAYLDSFICDYVLSADETTKALIAIRIAHSPTTLNNSTFECDIGN